MSGPQQYLCRCTEPHSWGGECQGRATEQDEVRRGLLARLLAARTDPVGIDWDVNGKPHEATIHEVPVSLPDAELLIAIMRTLVDGADAAIEETRDNRARVGAST